MTKKHTDINVDELLKVSIESQVEDIDTSDEFEKGTKVKVLDSGDKHLASFVGKIGIADNTVRYEHTKKTKVIFNNGEQGYFKNEYLRRN